jgi:cellulose synthase/poly-beta-1,6-N-acetylglucosamine synthase-like glycosyltransferase
VLLSLYSIVSILLDLCYAFFFVLYIKHWKSLSYFKNTEPALMGGVPKTFISVLIPARNEENNILPCIASILKNNYPKDLFEIIVIDDHSEDKTPQYVNDLKHPNVRLIELKNYIKLADNQPFKKRAIEAAIGESKGSLIVTTDGDCIIPPKWLWLIAAFYETKGKRFIAAPVNFHDEQSFFERFQSLDYVGMMGITGAGVEGKFMNMCNGANLAYEKKLFYDVKGFQGIDHVSSGDDMLLMQKVARQYPDTLGFLKNEEATVLTKAKPTIEEFLGQRLRWASKSSSYTEWYTVFQLVIVFLFCASMIFNIVMGIFFQSNFFLLAGVSFLTKVVFDFIFLSMTTRFFNRQDLMKVFLPAQILHIIYIISVGLWSNFKKRYAWKGRVVK